jgi:glutamate 5-kinase
VADAGAVKALQKRRSLLAVGLTAVRGDFDRGEILEIVDESGQPVAVAKARISSESLATHLRTPNVEVAHADDIVLL